MRVLLYTLVLNYSVVELQNNTLNKFTTRPRLTASFIYRLTHSASELSGFTCASSLTMNEKFQYRTRRPRAVLKNFEFIVSERVQVNPDNSRGMSVLTFLLFKLNTLQAEIVKL